MRVRVVTYDARWPREFEREAESLEECMGSNLVRLHHIGSTSVPGLAAKPVLDILAEVEALGPLDAQSDAIEALGYEAMGAYGIPGRRYFRKSDTSGNRTHHIHAFEAESHEVRRHLSFRDYLRAHPKVAAEYGQLKTQLAAQFPEDIEGYMDGKDAFIKHAEALALAWDSDRP